MPKNDEIPRGQLSTIILSTLLSSDKYGYEIINEVAERTNGKLTIKQPSLYSCLRRMEEQSLISSYWRDSDIGGRRHYYRITDYGKKYVEKWQTDILLPQDKSEDSSSPTFLEQTNLFGEQKQEKEPYNQEIEVTDNSYIQYDLFSSTTPISKPSVEIFETIKEKQEEKMEKVTEDGDKNQVIASDDRISKLRNFTSDNEKDLEPVNIKQEFLLLKKKQKSFTESYKTEDIDYKDRLIDDFNNIINNTQHLNINHDEDLNNQNQQLETAFEDQGVFLEQIEKTELVNQKHSTEKKEDYDNIENNEQINKDELSTNSYEPIFVNLDNDSAPTIYQSTTKFYDNTENILTEEKPENLNTEDKQINYNLDNYSQLETKTITESYTDGGIFITEKINFENRPKVKKIAPARFEHLNNSHSSIIDKKIQKLYNKPERQEHLLPENDVVEEEKTSQVVNYTNYDQLSQYYKENGILFSPYKKTSNTNKSISSMHIKVNKFNLLLSLSIFVCVILETLLMGILISPYQPNFWWMYLTTSLIFTGYFTYNIVRYIKNKNKLCPKSAILELNVALNIIISVIGILILFAINLLCGMNMNNFISYSTSFIYLSVITLNLPLHSLFKFILLKINI